MTETPITETLNHAAQEDARARQNIEQVLTVLRSYADGDPDKLAILEQRYVIYVRCYGRTGMHAAILRKLVNILHDGLIFDQWPWEN